MFCNQRLHKFSKPLSAASFHKALGVVGQGLDESINLVIVAPVGKSEEFVLEVNEPRCFSGKEHLPICEFFQLDGHACQLIAFWNDSDRLEPGGFEILYQRSSEPGFFNQDGVRSVFFRLRNGLCFQFRIKKSISYDLKEVVVAFGRQRAMWRRQNNRW